jgi:sugar phosphate permease
MRALLQLAIVVYLCVPSLAWAADAIKDPLNYPLKQYAFMLSTALLGGLVSWYAKVRKGDVMAWNLSHLIGELCTSAFAGLIAFWICESFGFAPLITASLVGISGHMGTRAIQAFEDFAKARWGATKE